MSLYKLSETIKRLLPAILIVILALIILSLLWFYFFSRPGPDEKFGKFPQPSLMSRLSEDILTEHLKIGEFSVDVPRVLKVYKEEGVLSSDKLAKELGFSVKPKKFGGDLVWEDKNKRLSVREEGFKFSFTSKTAVKEGALSQEQATKKAQEQIKDLGLIDGSTDLNVVNLAEVRFEGGPRHGITGSEVDPNTYTIGFGVSRSGFELIDEFGSSEIFSVWVGKDEQIVKITGSTKIVGFDDSGTYPPKPYPKAEAEVLAGEGKIIGLDAPLKEGVRPRISYVEAEIKYLLSSRKNDFIQPVYVFSGEAKGRAGNVEIITVVAALSEEAYKKE